MCCREGPDRGPEVGVARAAGGHAAQLPRHGAGAGISTQISTNISTNISTIIYISTGGPHQQAGAGVDQAGAAEPRPGRVPPPEHHDVRPAVPVHHQL